MSSSFLIHGLIPSSDYPFMEMSEPAIRAVLSRFEIDHTDIKIVESCNIAAPMWTNLHTPSTIFFNPEFPIHEAAVIHEYGHLCSCKKILDSINSKIKTVDRNMLFLINAEYYADLMALSYMIKYKQFDMMRIHMLSMLFYEHRRKLIETSPGPHEIAAKRLFKHRIFKKYKKLLNPLEILQRKYYKPCTIITR